MSANFATAPEVAGLVSTSGGQKPRVQTSEVAVLTSTGPPPARFPGASEVIGLVSNVKGHPVIQTSEVVGLVSYVTSPRQIIPLRAFTFTFDGHIFYVVALGTIGTFVYDLTTKQWSNFATQGFNLNWNFEHGVEWNGGVYGMDNNNGTIWKLNPNGFLDDDFRPMLRTVTGLIEQEARDVKQAGGFYLNFVVQTLLPLDMPTVQLSISDDRAQTFMALDKYNVTQTQAQQVWRGLGRVKYPGRVFKIVDSGAFVQIAAAYVQEPGKKKVSPDQ